MALVRHPNRKLRNFLLDREYQFRYVGQMVAVSAGLTAGLGWLVYHFNAEASRVVGLRALDPTDEMAQSLHEQFSRSDHLLLAALIIFGVLLTAVLAAWQVVTTHKVAGPLYYISYQVKRIGDGYLGSLHPLRKGDMLHGFFETFREMHESLRKRARAEAAQFERLAVRADEAGLKELADELRVLQKQREESLQ
jgi:hypothetical protein